MTKNVDVLLEAAHKALRHLEGCIQEPRAVADGLRAAIDDVERDRDARAHSTEGWSQI